MCVVCDFNLVLGRQVGRRASLRLRSSPSHPIDGQRHLLMSLPLFFPPGLRVSCPEWDLFAHRPYRTILGKGEKRSPALEEVRE